MANVSRWFLSKWFLLLGGTGVAATLFAASASGKTTGNCCVLTDIVPQHVASFHGNPGFRVVISDYESYSNPTIPTVRTTLYLSKGARIVRSKFTVCCNYANPAAVQRVAHRQAYKMVRASNGIIRPQWVSHDISAQYGVTWFFWLAPARGSTKVCVTVLAVPRVKGGAPAQHGGLCQAVGH